MSVDQWDHRELCPDGACTGVIGPEGTCKTCGKPAPNWGDPRGRVVVRDTDDDSKPAVRAKSKSESGGEWTARKLCPDGTCVGLLGDDGKCKVCSKEAEDSEYDDEEQFENEEDADESDDAEDDVDEGDDDRETASDADADADGSARADNDHDDEDDEDDQDEDDDDDDDDDGNDEDDDDRKLCPDGACVGVIGPNNKCKQCGKSA